MARLTPAWMVVTGFALLLGSVAHASGLDEGAPDAVAPRRLALLAEPGAMPPPVESAPPATAGAPGSAGAAPAAGLVEEGAPRPADLSYGVGARLRWVSIPRWMLNLFTKTNVPLSSWATALEVFRRKGDFEFIVSVGYQNMSPGDGNWLGKSHDASVDTDYVQFKGLGFVGLDASFVWHTAFNDWFGMHYGAGIGLGIVTGSIQRTSNFSGCTDANAGDVSRCHPLGVDPTSSTTIDRQIQNLGPGVDDPADPHRFTDNNVPGAIPIVNILVGLDFRLPRLRGWEAKLEGGFYDAFFLGGGVGMTF
jgi:hypothetical protein